MSSKPPPSYEESEEIKGKLVLDKKFQGGAKKASTKRVKNASKEYDRAQVQIVKNKDKRTTINHGTAIGAVSGAGAGAGIGGTIGAIAGTFVLPGLGSILGGAIGVGLGALFGGGVAGAIGGGVASATYKATYKH